MTHHYATPGVYIEEVTGPSVIAGVGTSTAAFIGPALSGPLNVPRRISSLDDFVTMYGGTRDNLPWPYLFLANTPYYLAFAVEGFFTNGGQQAYIVRVGTAAQARLPIQNRAGEAVFVVQACQDGTAGNNMSLEIQQYVVQAAATATAAITNVAGATVRVDNPGRFQVGDFVSTEGVNRAQINQIQGSNLILSAPLAGAANGNVLRIDNIPTGQNTIRLISTAGHYTGGVALMRGDDADNPGTMRVERVVTQDVNRTANVVTLAAAPARAFRYAVAAGNVPTLTSVRVIARGQANVTGSAGATVTVDAPTQFRPWDIVTSDGVNRARINQIRGNDLILDQPLAGLGGTIRIADIIPSQTTFRVADASGLYPGTIARLTSDNDANADYLVVQGVDGAGFVTLEPAPVRANTYSLNVAAGSEPLLIPQEFRLIITPPPSGMGTIAPERIENLSLNPYYPRYVFNTGVFSSTLVTVDRPAQAPTNATYLGQLVPPSGPTSLAGGRDDQPSGLASAEYQTGLNALRDIDDVNILCIPDAATHVERQTIQNAMIDHCLFMRDRFAILDSRQGATPTGTDSVEDQRQLVQATNGFAALYYPWLAVRDPSSSGAQPRTMLIPPSGHIAGVYARTDAEIGVHKAPANTDVRGVLGLERCLSDGQQGPLNLKGINVLRIFPGSGQVTVWGARTTVDPNVTDWLYIPVRRLLLYIEESIQEGIRWAVFQPNNLALWQQLKRTISDFLLRVWQDGALFGATADQAFRVRIDEALNPPSTRALGRLYIEVKVAAVRPAEFIVVRIGLWDGGAEVRES